MAINACLERWFHKASGSWSYLLYDRQGEAAIIDPVLDYDGERQVLYPAAADAIVAVVKQRGLSLRYVLETHVHADRFSAAHYLQQRLGGQLAISAAVVSVLRYWQRRFSLQPLVPLDGQQFDRLLGEGECLPLGSESIAVWQTPGHTPTCLCFLYGDWIFVGDTLLVPECGTARCDFPGGDAASLYASIHRLYALDGDRQLFLCHDYPAADRAPQSMVSLQLQREHNCLLSATTTEAEYVARRQERSIGVAAPELLPLALPYNLAGHALPAVASRPWALPLITAAAVGSDRGGAP